VSDQIGFWIFCAAIIALAAILLWLRDRYRDFRHVPESVRKLAEQKNSAGASAFVSGLFALTCVYRAFQAQTLLSRAVPAGIAIFLAWACVQRFRRYRKIGSNHGPGGM
jgi:membrane associated rhomboid family serine protease